MTTRDPDMVSVAVVSVLACLLVACGVVGGFVWWLTR